jgi:tRNA-(ms[2]io[6]A)-hydroxylase
METQTGMLGIDEPKLRLRSASRPEWLAAVLADFDAFLLDHASAERKASAVAMSLITHYPDRRELVTAMLDLAREELEHFHQVYRLIDSRGLILTGDRKDLYVRSLRDQIRRGQDAYFLDRLLVSGIVEARGCERFGSIAEAIQDPELKAFYGRIAQSEERHGDLFIELAGIYFDGADVMPRLAELLDFEADLVSGLEIRSALH